MPRNSCTQTIPIHRALRSRRYQEDPWYRASVEYSMDVALFQGGQLEFIPEELIERRAREFQKEVKVTYWAIPNRK